MKFVTGWAHEATLSGIDVGGVHAVDILREEKACDQSPPPQDSAFKLGESQGKALLESAEQAVLPTVPKTICNTDTIAATILAEAKNKVPSFKQKQENAVCYGYQPSDLAQAVDLSEAETNRSAGIDEGLRAGFESLRVRLVNSWVCEQPAPAPPTGDPLVVDLDGNGVQLAGARVAFDLAATGEKVEMPALSRGDALLVLDVDGNGRIDSGAELMSNAASCGARRCLDGIEALASHDANADGVIDVRDPAYGRLLLWNDTNRDGQSTPDELQSLSAAGIVSISLASSIELAWTDGQGSASLRSASFVRQAGGNGTVHDVWFGLQLPTIPADPQTTGLISTLPSRAR